MEGKGIKNLLASSDIKIKKPVLVKIYSIYHEIRKAAPQSLYLYYIAIFFRYVNLLQFILNSIFITNWDKAVGDTISTTLSYFTLHYYTQTKYGAAKYIIFYTIASIFIFYIVLLIVLMFSKKVRQSSFSFFMYYYMGFVSLIIVNGFSLSFYYIIGNFMVQNNPLYFETRNYDIFGTVNIVLGSIGLLCILAVFGMSLVYIYTDNPFVSLVCKGSNKMLELMAEFEKLGFVIYFIVDSKAVVIKQFVIFLLIFNLVKFYIKLIANPFYNIKIEVFENFFNGFYFFSIVTINFSIFIADDKKNGNVIFYLFILDAILALFTVLIFMISATYRFVYKNPSLLSEEEAKNTIVNLAIYAINPTSYFYKEKAINFVKAHNSECNDRDCPCFTIIRVQYNSVALQTSLICFIERFATALRHLFPKNLDILIYLITIKIYKRGKLYRGIYVFVLTKNLKPDIVQDFELYSLR